MEDLIASVKDIKFDIETFIEQQIGIQPLPFPGMDKSGSGVCDFYFQGTCTRGHLCPFRHTIGEKAVVCKHWLRGLCKKGDECEFLHEYDMSKMPECYFFSRFGTCNNKECPFLHIDPLSRRKDCPCPRFDLPLYDSVKGQANQVICHACGEPGHKLTFCPMVLQYREKQMAGGMNTEQIPRRPLELVTCFKCRQRGHYANRCPFPAVEPNPAFRPRMMMPPPMQPTAPQQNIHTIPTIG
eukprot:gene9278-10256_t